MSLTAPEVPGPASQDAATAAAPVVDYAMPPAKTGLSALTGAQWRSGIAAWLGWLFDGLDMHLYTLVATPVVAQLLAATSTADPGVKEKRTGVPPSFSSTPFNPLTT